MYAVDSIAGALKWSRDLGEQNTLGFGRSMAIESGDNDGLALKADGTVVAWGPFPGNVPDGLSNVVAIHSIGGTSFALQDDGPLVTWTSSAFDSSRYPTSATIPGTPRLEVTADGQITITSRQLHEGLPSSPSLVYHGRMQIRLLVEESLHRGIDLNNGSKPPRNGRTSPGLRDKPNQLAINDIRPAGIEPASLVPETSVVSILRRAL